ncbi:MAG: hypothetical protein IIA68_11595, partial [Proteobacteria bacterium]|nr:hypothetical protein [Pseudomonadota bacterium]
MTEDLNRGDLNRGASEDTGAEVAGAEGAMSTDAMSTGAMSTGASFTGTEGGEQLIGQASILVARPEPGQTVQISAEPGQTYVLDFDPSQARALVDGDNLILVFEDGAQIVFEDLVNLVQLENAPGLQYAGQDMIALLQAQGVIPGVLEGFELIEPEPGQIIIIQAGLGQRFIINFDPAAAQVSVEGDNLVMTFANGGQIVIQGLGGLITEPGAPTFSIAGVEIEAATLFSQAIALSTGEAGPEAAATLEVAAGAEPLPSGGVGLDESGPGEPLDLLNAQGVIPPVEMEFGLIDLEPTDLEAPNEPPSADPVLTPADSGTLPPALLSALSGLGGGTSGSVVNQTVTIAGSGQPGSVGYVFFTIDSDTAITITTDGPTIDPQMYLFVNDGSLDAGDFLATDDDDGLPAGLFFNSIINTGDEIGILPAGSYIIAVGDFFLSGDEAISGTNDSSSFGSFTGDVTITIEADSATVTVADGTADIAFFKELTVDGAIGDSDLTDPDLGGANGETALADLVFTLTGDPNYGTLILDPDDGSPATVLNVGDTFTSADTIWWIATESDISGFEVVPDATFTYSVTDADGNVATAPVLITIGGEPTGGETSIAVDEDDLPSGNSDVAT